MTETFRVALDWTPNTNHIGLYVAQAKGWFREVGVDVVFLPQSDSLTDGCDCPGKKVLSGHADIGIAPSEALFGMWSGDNNHPVAVATLLQKDASALVTIQSSGIEHLRQLDGKRYACFGSKLEVEIVKELIRGDGGEGNIIEDTPPRLSAFNQVLDGNADCAWIYLHWEGIHAEMNEVPVNVFLVGEGSCIKYGYSSVLFAAADILHNEARATKLAGFLSACTRGYQFAVDNPEEAVDLLVSQANHPALEQTPREFLLNSMQYLIANKMFFNDDGRWGVMKPERWQNFANALFQRNLITTHDRRNVTEEELNPNSLFTNIFLSP